PDAGLKFRIVRGCGQEHADTPDALALLRAGDERPRRSCTAKNTEKFPPPHVTPWLRRHHRNGSNECFDRAWKRLRHCNMRCWPMSDMGRCCRKSRFCDWAWAHVSLGLSSLCCRGRPLVPVLTQTIWTVVCPAA